MAVVYECDRCHKQDKSARFLKPVALPHLNRANDFTDEDNDGYTKYLCAPCVRVLTETLNHQSVK